MRFTFDSDLNRTDKNTPANIPLDMVPVAPPATLVRTFRVLALHSNDDWHEVAHIENNYQRLVRVPLDTTARALRFVPEATWGAPDVHVFAWDVN